MSLSDFAMIGFFSISLFNSLPYKILRITKVLLEV